MPDVATFIVRDVPVKFVPPTGCSPITGVDE